MDSLSAFLLAFFMAVGITQPGGAGTTIFFYDNVSAPDTIAYHFADFAAAFPADFVDNGTTPKTYRSKVSVQCGDVGSGTATTTLTDTNVGVWFDTGKVLQYRGTQTTSWNTNFGTKVGTGNKASGRNGIKLYQGGTSTIRGNAGIYGSIIESQGGNMNFTPAISGSNFELINCIVGNAGTGATSVIVVGTSAAALSNLYNVDFWGNISGASFGILTTFNAAMAERISVGGPSMGSFIRSAQGTLAVKDIVFFGTPSGSDMMCTASTPVTWTLVDMGWSGNAPKFGAINAGVTVGSITEYRSGDIKAGDGSGNNSPGVSAKLTDTLSNVIFNTTTDAAGRVSFGSGLTLNTVPVMDHYGDGVSYLTRPRSPFLMEVGTQRYFFNWPTDVNGNFEDMADVVPSSFASGGPTSWSEYELGSWPP